MLEGIVVEKGIDTVVLSVGGVGYGVNITSEDNGSLAAGQKTKLYIYEHIRETSHELFGFIAKNTMQLFEQLLSVNGIGPKMALGVLSLGTVDTVANAIANQDAQFVQQASGVGKRVAERIVVDLKDKVGVAGGYAPASGISNQDEAVQGLMALGFTQADAQTALANIDNKLPIEERIKQALKGQAR